MPLSRARMRLRAILVVIALASSVPLGLFAAWLLSSSWQQQRAQVDRQNIETARAISVAVDQEVESTTAALNVLAALHLLSDPDLPAFRELASRVVAQNDRWRGILLIDGDGRIVMDTGTEAGEQQPNFPDKEWVQQTAARQPGVSDLIQDPATQRYFVMIGVPVVRGGEQRYVLAAQIGSQSLSDILRRQHVPQDGVVTLLDGKRIIMARTRGEASFVGKLPTEGFQAAAVRMSEGPWQEVLLEGTPAYAALSRSALTGWTLGIGQPSEAVDAPMRRSFWALAAVVMGILALSVSSTLLLGRGVARSLGAASAAAKALAKGEPAVIPDSPVVEVNELAAGLADAAAILEKRLQERDAAESKLARAVEERELALRAEQVARTASEQNELRLAVTLGSIGDGVIATDAQGRVTMLNRVAQVLTGWKESEAVGLPMETVLKLISEETRQTVENPVAKVFRVGEIVGLANHTLLITRDGREIPIEDSAAPIRGAGGALLGVVLVFRDATEKREIERQRAAALDREQAARHRAEEVSREKDEFIATVSHELRNPLSAMLGWVRLLQDGKLDSQNQAHAFEVIERNARAQARLVDDLLDMARVVRGQLRLEMQPVNLVSPVQAAVESVDPTAAAKEIKITVASESAKVLVSGDAGRLQQILWNLLTNSIKFTPKGGRIDIGLHVEGSEACLRVRDSGNGISAEFLPHVFERFAQGSPSISRSHSGLGIGLALVRHLVELHGGTIEAMSEGEGRGSTFTIRLPVLGRPALMTGEQQPSGDAPAETDGALNTVHVLVVEDDPDARDLITTTLRQAGANVTPVGSASDALDVLESQTPTVMVSDIAMPNVTGYDLVQQLRKDERLGRLPTVALTAYSRSEDRERALQAGFDYHVGKPVDPSVLIQVVAAAAAGFSTRKTTGD